MDLQKVVQDALDRVVAEEKECGCQAALYVDGKLEVSAFAGWTDWTRTKKVDEQTIFPVYSTGKGPCSTSLLRLVEKGIVNYDTYIRDFWPEFACNGKEAMQVYHVLSYRCGLQNVPKATVEEYADFWKMTEMMAKETPSHAIGAKQQYHPFTYGWLVGGMVCHLLKRTDYPQIFKELVGDIAEMDRWYYGAGEEEAQNAAQMVARHDGTCIDSFGLSIMNMPILRRCCNPGVCAMSNAVSIARHYAALDQGRLLRPETLDVVLKPCRDEADPFDYQPTSWELFGLGYTLRGPRDNPGLVFGHNGWSGAVGILDRRKHYALGFTRNLFALPNDSFEAVRAALNLVVKYW